MKQRSGAQPQHCSLSTRGRAVTARVGAACFIAGGKLFAARVATSRRRMSAATAASHHQSRGASLSRRAAVVTANAAAAAGRLSWRAAGRSDMVNVAADVA